MNPATTPLHDELAQLRDTDPEPTRGGDHDGYKSDELRSLADGARVVGSTYNSGGGDCRHAGRCNWLNAGHINRMFVAPTTPKGGA